ncbi:hypothetical protein IFM47457_01760 [Aspergillus lentulus]|nr:hypothetical protein IFM47457_01760 [Aspergillus lentulus]
MSGQGFGLVSWGVSLAGDSTTTADGSTRAERSSSQAALIVPIYLVCALHALAAENVNHVDVQAV